ncbi:hypothetical protein E2320_006577 [Naja naja]|nr:hypothetical protein E2320_006577 [Naja naja]
MKFLLFALGLALCCVVQAGWEEVTTCSKEDLGRWVSFAIACNSPEAVEQIKHMPAFVADVSKPKEDVFSISALIPMPDGCKKVTHQFRKGEDGKYQSFSVWREFIMSTININNESRVTTLHGSGSLGELYCACNSPESLEQIKHMPAFVADLSKPKEDVFSISALIPMRMVWGEFIMSTINVNNESTVTTLHGRTVTQNTEILQKFKEECDQSKGLKTARGSSWACFRLGSNSKEES